MPSPSIINLSKLAEKVQAAMAVVPIGALGHLSVNVYVIQGQVDWHRHPDEDELFLVHEGVVTLETELGNQILHPEELAVVPKGVGHRTGSPLRSVALLIRPEVMSERSNGKRRQGVTDADPRLEKLRLARLRRLLSLPYHPLALTRLADYQISLNLAEGVGPATRAPRGGLLILVLRGGLQIHLEAEALSLADGELTVLPTGAQFFLSAPEPAVYVSMGTAWSRD